jgi:hypothetical protein
MNKLKTFLLIVGGVFVSTAGPLFLANVTNVFETDWSTWTIIISGGVFGLVAYAMVWLAPITIKPSSMFGFKDKTTTTTVTTKS